MTSILNHLKEELGKPDRTVTGRITPEDLYEGPGIEVAGRSDEQFARGYMRGAYSVSRAHKGVSGRPAQRSGQQERMQERPPTGSYI